jgi:hypothetical protein
MQKCVCFHAESPTFWLILTKIIMLQQMLTELPNIKFHKILFTGALCEQIDEAILTGTPLGCGIWKRTQEINKTTQSQSRWLISEVKVQPLCMKTHALYITCLVFSKILTTRSIQTDTTGVVITTSAMQKEKQIENYCPLYAIQTTRPALWLSRQAK